MGEMIYKELAMVKTGNYPYWQNVFQRSLTNGLNIETFEQAVSILEQQFSQIINKQFVQEGNQIFILSDVPIDCINCN